MKRPSAVILDMDGLMLDTERVARSAWQRAASERGFTIDDSLYVRIIGRTPADTKEILIDALGDAFPYREARSSQQAYLRQAIERGELASKPGLQELLRTIEDLGLKRAIATSTHRPSALRKLSGVEMKEVFDAIVCGDDVQNGKPAPDIFLEAARRLGVLPERCVVFEDSDAGAIAAHAADMKVIVVPDLKEPGEETRAIAWRVLPSLHAAACFLTTMCHDDS